MDAPARERRISIIGTGDFGRAAGKRLIASGYAVMFGSRRPHDRQLSAADPVLAEAEISSIRQAIVANDVILLALRFAQLEELARCYKSELSGKLVIDVSNRDNSCTQLSAYSNAELLQEALPHSTIAKAFNTTSAFTLASNQDGGSRAVPVASDNRQARETVREIARDMGLHGFDAGLLRAARDLELLTTSLFPLWSFSLLCALGIFLLWWLFISYLYFMKESRFTWEQLFVKLTNKPLAMTAITMLSLTYMPGSVAGYLQLINGTKHKRFPVWLDAWLRYRKQLGLSAFGLSCLHVCMSVMLLSPTYYSSWFHRTNLVLSANASLHYVVSLPVTSWMTWKGETACLTGTLTFAILCILAVTSLPSVAASLNWAEWRFIQSRLGYLGLCLATSHTCVMGFPSWIQKAGLIDLLQSITFMSSLIPAVTLIMRMSLSLPIVRAHLRKIRHGWERYSPAENLRSIHTIGEPNFSLSVHSKRPVHSLEFHQDENERGLMVRTAKASARYVYSRDVPCLNSSSHGTPMTPLRQGPYSLRDCYDKDQEVTTTFPSNTEAGQPMELTKNTEYTTL